MKKPDEAVGIRLDEVEMIYGFMEGIRANTLYQAIPDILKIVKRPFD